MTKSFSVENRISSLENCSFDLKIGIQNLCNGTNKVTWSFSGGVLFKGYYSAEQASATKEAVSTVYSCFKAIGGEGIFFYFFNWERWKNKKKLLATEKLFKFRTRDYICTYWLMFFGYFLAIFAFIFVLATYFIVREGPNAAGYNFPENSIHEASNHSLRAE